MTQASWHQVLWISTCFLRRKLRNPPLVSSHTADKQIACAGRWGPSPWVTDRQLNHHPWSRVQGLNKGPKVVETIVRRFRTIESFGAVIYLPSN